MDKDRNRRSETVLNITLEIIYLLTGEDYIIVSKTSGENVKSSSLQLSGGWTRTQSSNMEPQSLIPERNNDLKILELTNKIIQLLTGEDRDCVEEPKDLDKENQQPLISSDFTSEGSRIEINIQAVKEEGVSMDTDHPHIQCSYTAIKEESGDKGDLINPNIQALLNHAQESILCNIKEEHASPKEEILTDTDIAAPTDYTQQQSTDTKVISEKQSLGDTDNCTSSGQAAIKYTNIHIKSDTGGVEKVTDAKYSTPLSETQHSPSQVDQIHQTQEKPFLCSVCGKYFTCKAVFIKHQKLHTGAKEFSCSVCGKTFKSKSYFSEHQRLHTGEKPYSCVECGKCFISKSQLVCHHKVHTGEKPFSCVECGKCFLRKAHLVIHHAVHTGEKPYFCSECGKSFQTKSNLVKHQMLHTRGKPFTCAECGKSFINNEKLVLHRKIHTVIKPFPCSECGLCFTTQSFLVTHRKIHAGDRVYCCNECEKCYNSNSALGRHLRTHTGEKPYCCNECGKRYYQNTHLLRHQKIHTK